MAERAGWRCRTIQLTWLSMVVGVVVSITPTTVAAQPSVREAMPSRTVVLYGDSLGWEAAPHFVVALTRFGPATVVTHTFGGTALCDWFDQMQADVGSLDPDAVVIQFSGNNLTPCMRGADGHGATGLAWLARYYRDVRLALRLYDGTGTRVYLVGSPRSASATQAVHAFALHRLYAAAALISGAEYVDAGRAVLADGRWTPSLPCLVDEPCDAIGTAVVRAPDTVHFCPAPVGVADGVIERCPAWSSGAYRYGRAMAEPVIRDLF